MAEAGLVDFRAGSTTLHAYLARPEGQGPFPAVVVIHEVYGLNENMKDIARRFAGEGYVGLAVDLFSGRSTVVCMARFFSGMLFNSLNHLGIQELKSALSFLTAQPGVDGARVGAVGYCMGGSFAVAWACTDRRLRAIAPFYGMNPRPLGAVARCCPVVGSYPDPDFTTKAGRDLDLALDEHHIPHDIKIYPGAKHSFFNNQSANHDSAAAADSWRRVLAFFQEHIGG